MSEYTITIPRRNTPIDMDCEDISCKGNVIESCPLPD